ncbi:helix-turn-helix domain-containing protein [Ligilactobacillus agilis]|uniref:helix-turn-helix domain-containing protein n=1 Tax=Ligilactobacillus agilis TaxID=1601 RepID=UPI00243088E0|nr:helix-turn-helix domain-containing protein [Ligilactobacillus agilis]
MNEYMTYKEAYQLLGFKSYKGLNQLINEGLPVIVVGKSKRISKKDLDEFMAKNRKVVK